jgi:hypothetical protein
MKYEDKLVLAFESKDHNDPITQFCHIWKQQGILISESVVRPILLEMGSSISQEAMEMLQQAIRDLQSMPQYRSELLKWRRGGTPDRDVLKEVLIGVFPPLGLSHNKNKLEGLINELQGMKPYLKAEEPVLPREGEQLRQELGNVPQLGMEPLAGDVEISQSQTPELEEKEKRIADIRKQIEKQVKEPGFIDNLLRLFRGK